MMPELPVIVPLGGNCFPRWCATLLEFKPRKADGERTFPLDAGLFPLAMVRHLAESDFEGMADPANLIVRTAPEGINVLSDRRFPLGTYNHEMPPATEIDFTSNAFERFAERYQRRIDDLHATLRSARRVVLFLTVSNLCGPEEPPFSQDDLEAILSSFEKRYPSVAFRMLVTVERFQTRVPDAWDGRMRVFNFQMPGPYTRYILPYVSAIAMGNVLGSVVHSFGDEAVGAPGAAPASPDMATIVRVARNAMEAQVMTSLFDTPIPALMASEGPTGVAMRAIAGLFARAPRRAA